MKNKLSGSEALDAWQRWVIASPPSLCIGFLLPYFVPAHRVFVILLMLDEFGSAAGRDFCCHRLWCFLLSFNLIYSYCLLFLLILLFLLLLLLLLFFLFSFLFLLWCFKIFTPFNFSLLFGFPIFLLGYLFLYLHFSLSLFQALFVFLNVNFDIIINLRLIMIISDDPIIVYTWLN